MDTVMKPVQTGRGRRRWSSEQKLAVLQEWQTGIPLEEICRKYAVNAAWMYRPLNTVRFQTLEREPSCGTA